MLLKIMGAEDASDSDSRKTFRLLAGVTAVDFARKQGGSAVAGVSFDDGTHEEFEVVGNAYAMNDNGDTVASFGAAGIPDAA